MCENKNIVAEQDAKNKAEHILAQIKSVHGGKFKLSEKQFIEYMSHMWIYGELSAGERILFALNEDPSLNRDTIIGELHLFVLETFKVLKKRLNLKMDICLDDFLFGRFSKNKVD